jgi:hypothetical protein
LVAKWGNGVPSIQGEKKEYKDLKERKPSNKGSEKENEKDREMTQN